MSVKGSPRLHGGSNRLKSAEIGCARKSQKTPCFYVDVQTKPLTTEELAVPGIEVVGAPKGKAFVGPFYSDQLELLRETLRAMRRRDRFEVAPDGDGFSIYRKPASA